MSLLIQLAIYAALAAGAAFAFHEFEQVYYVKPAEVRGAADQRAKDQPVLDQVKLERDNARTDTESCVAKIKPQSDAVDEWKRIAAMALADSRAARAAQAREATAAAPRIAQLQADAAAKPKLMACAEELAKAKDTLREAIKVRRGLPAAPAAPVPK